MTPYRVALHSVLRLIFFKFANYALISRYCKGTFSFALIYNVEMVCTRFTAITGAHVSFHSFLRLIFPGIFQYSLTVGYYEGLSSVFCFDYRFSSLQVLVR